MDKLIRVCSFFVAAVLLSAFLTSCDKRKPVKDDSTSMFSSFRDIPGVTQGEIDAIEELRKNRKSFIYSSVYGTELFVGENGRIGGFSAQVCTFLSELFGIPFVPTINEWHELIPGLESGAIDFTGELASNPDRRKKYFMTDDIAQRQIITIRIKNEIPLKDIARTRTPRYAFLKGSNTVDFVSDREHHKFEAYFVDDYSHAYEMLKAREVDAFFAENHNEAAFDFYSDIAVSIYYPLIYSPVSLSTQNPELEPVISIMQKALENGAINHMTYLYNQGRWEYLQHKLFLLLTEEENEYIRNNPTVPYVAETTNYPVSFYDNRAKRWEGITIDLIAEMERLTGLEFKRLNDSTTHWPELLRMLEAGEAAMITELIQSEDRAGEFLWAGEYFLRDSSALVSKMEFRDLNINEILYARIGVAVDTAHSKITRNWFPNHKNIIDYADTYSAFNALEKGEIDVVMTSEHQLLTMTNYREHVGYKANVVFDIYFDMTFGFNKNEDVLCSIVTKAMKVIDVENISRRWMRRTYDYRMRLVQERIPFMIGGAMLLIGLVFAVFLFAKKHREGLRLETLVDIRTKELSEKQRQLLKAAEDAQEASRTKSAFLANMSHEIRTPMNAIIGMSEILEHEKLTEHQMSYVKDISLSANSLLVIINDILDMSKIESGKFELNPVDFSLNQMMDNLTSMFAHVAHEKGLEFTVEAEPGLPDCLYGDDIRLRQILTNICGNAVKFTQKGCIKLLIASSNGNLIFKIEDTGKGIQKQDMHNLFKVFEQVDKFQNREVKGTGLGLSICKSFVEMMGGSIAVESEYGQGTAFTITIPIVPGNPENIRKDEINKVRYTISAPDAKILITDDNEFNLKVAIGLLGFMDIAADSADSGFKALELVMQTDYDIVFMDHMMPEMDGIETVREIRKWGGKYQNLVIVALTANAVKGARDMFLGNGFNDFIAKPIDANKLREIIQKYLPPEKIRKGIITRSSQAIANMEEQLHRKTILSFVRENINSLKNINDALHSGDIKTAHRVAHNLKSSSGYLGLKDLQEAAFSLEQSLQAEAASFTPEQLAELEKNLNQAFREFEPLVQEEEAKKHATVKIGEEELKALLTELEPLLRRGDYTAMSYIEKLQGIEGMAGLIERIDDYDFEGALQLLQTPGQSKTDAGN